MAFIIDSFNRYDQWDREHSVYTFEVNENWYAIFEIELEWGLPVLAYRITQEKDSSLYKVYGSKEEALGFVQRMRQLN